MHKNWEIRDFTFGSAALADLAIEKANEYWIRNRKDPLPVSYVFQVRITDTGGIEPTDEDTGTFAAFGNMEGKDTSELMVSNVAMEWVDVSTGLLPA